MLLTRAWVRSLWASCTLAFVGCSFDGTAGGHGGDGADAAVGDGVPCPFQYKDVCVQLKDAQPQSFDESITIDTGTSTFCAKPPLVPDAAPYCIVVGSTIAIASGAVVRGIGSRPLVFAASESITVDGTIDVSSTRAVPSILGAGAALGPCGEMTRDAIASGAEAGGGAGGTMQGIGGNGGDGNTDPMDRAFGGKPPSKKLDPPTNALWGGCAGQSGAASGAALGGVGGAGGGAVYLAAKTSIDINETGRVGANGAGGRGGDADRKSGQDFQAGGGGGGSGGFIALDAPTIRCAGHVTANGGGGGEGGFVNGSTPVPGDPGANGSISVSRAGGGNGEPPNKGGDGGASDVDGESAVHYANAGGGGGGGASGYIRAIPSLEPSASAVISPPLQ
ncbi:MAG: hypothetical protein R3B48_27075 [Kofleriaceae bacterium]